jgi:hypothetical protein
LTLVSFVILTGLAGSNAGATTSLKALERYVLSPADVRPLGFTKVLEKLTTATTATATGEKSCPHGAEQVFEDASGQTGLASEVLECTNNAAAQEVLKQEQKQSSAVKVLLPKELGTTAIERYLGRFTYGIYWRRGTVLEVVALTTSLTPATATTTTTTAVPSPLTATQQAHLSNAALKQNRLLR